jgi:SAM-dependent methyltransferase
VAALGGRRFDVVYTGLGALNWLPDVRRWARVVGSLVAPDGFLYLSEFHPFTWVFSDDHLTVEHDYFQREAFAFDDPGTYADMAAETTQNRTEEWQHTLGEVVTAVIEAGLELDLLHEHDHTLHARWPFLEERDGTFRQPEGSPRLPLMYSLKARSSRHA